MTIKDKTLPGGHVVMVKQYDICEKCGEEKTDIMFYGEVCINCKEQKQQEPMTNNNLLSDLKR